MGIDEDIDKIIEIEGGSSKRLSTVIPNVESSREVTPRSV